MSGGHFDYIQRRMFDVSDEISNILNRQGQKVEHPASWDDEFYPTYPEEVRNSLEAGRIIIKLAAIYTHRIDWYLSGDDGEDSFLENLEKDLDKFRSEDD